MRSSFESSAGDAETGLTPPTADPASAMAYAAHLTPIYPLTIGGFTMPGYTAFYTLLLNLVVAVTFTPLVIFVGTFCRPDVACRLLRIEREITCIRAFGR